MAVRFMKAFTTASIVAGAAAYSTCFVVRPGEAAVVYNRFTGVRDQVLTEGLQFRMLGIEEPKIFNVRLQPRELTTMTGTKDLQLVNIRLRVLYTPAQENLPHIFRTLGLDYAERVLPSVSNEVLKATIAEYRADDLIVNREAVSERLSAAMRERIKEYHIHLEDISLVHIQFGQEFMAAVEQKQVAQQEAERFKFVVLENEQNKQAAIIRAEGEAEAAKMISAALAKSGPGLVQLRALQGSLDVAKDLTSAANVNFVPGGSDMLLNMGNARKA